MNGYIADELREEPVLQEFRPRDIGQVHRGERQSARRAEDGVWRWRLPLPEVSL